MRVCWRYSTLMSWKKNITQTKFNSVHLMKEEFLSWTGLRTKRSWASSPWQLMQWYFRYLIWKQRRKSLSLATAVHLPYLDLVWWFMYLIEIWYVDVLASFRHSVFFFFFGHGMVIFLSVMFPWLLLVKTWLFQTLLLTFYFNLVTN